MSIIQLPTCSHYHFFSSWVYAFMYECRCRHLYFLFSSFCSKIITMVLHKQILYRYLLFILQLAIKFILLYFFVACRKCASACLNRSLGNTKVKFSYGNATIIRIHILLLLTYTPSVIIARHILGQVFQYRF